MHEPLLTSLRADSSDLLQANRQRRLQAAAAKAQG